MKKFFVIATSLLLGASVFAQSKWFKAQSKSASVKSVTATSELVEAQFDGKYLYPPINILDGDFNSTWCEADQKGSGIGESITVEFAEPVSFDEIQIVNGFVSKDYYLK
uniref:discoidin domain-containing protein n=1 Tax=Treponema sp. TaxID=166 RepID=UPI00388FE519